MIIDPNKKYKYVPISDFIMHKIAELDLGEYGYPCLIDGHRAGVNPLGVLKRWRETNITHVLIETKWYQCI